MTEKFVQVKMELDTDELATSSRRKQSGISTTDVITSSHFGQNPELFKTIMHLHVPKGSRVADVTYGKGVFWKKLDSSDYDLVASDIATGTDARALPYESESFDALILDPPYMEGLYRRSKNHLAGGGTHAAFREYYSNGETTDDKGLKYHDLVIDMYMRSAEEARRVLKPDGTFIVKCQDEVSANRQKLTHVEIIYGCAGLGFYCKDLFVLTRSNKPAISRLVRQEHARKNHSYFLVFKKPKTKLPYNNFGPIVNRYWQKS